MTKENAATFTMWALGIFAVALMSLTAFAGNIAVSVSGLQADNKTTKAGIERIEAKLDRLIEGHFVPD